jgi:DNA-binding SARP family transcriptional activator
VEFRILGPLEVWSGGQPVAVGSPKDRMILGLLLVEANRTVAVDRLIASLWERPPASARKNVQTHVWALRRLFTGTAGDGRIDSGPHGYRLRVGPDELDAALFERWVAEGQRLLAAGEPGKGGERLRAALALWRGAPLCDVPLADSDRGVLVRWEERRRAAVEDRVEAELREGQHAGLVAELHELVALHPLRERLWGQLMLALYRCGRQADALEAYTLARTALRDELGLDPGPALQRLHHDILNRDRALELAPATTAFPINQPPADVVDFTGRANEYDRLHASATAANGPGSAAAPPVTVVAGPAGVGKTALAVHLAHQIAEDFPDGQLYADLHGAGPDRLPPDRTLGRFLRDLGVPNGRAPAALEARAALYRSLLFGKRYLILLDNAADEAQVRPLLPGGAGCTVLVTSRDRLAGLTGARTLSLDVPGADDARLLLSRILGPQRTAAEPGPAAEVVRLCGRLPLALRVAGARLAARPAWSLAQLVSRLTDERSRLTELAAGDLEVRAAFESSYQALPEPERAVFEVLGRLDADAFDAAAVAGAAGLPAAAAGRLLERLVDVHLVEVLPPGDRYIARVLDLSEHHLGDIGAGDPGRQEPPAPLKRVERHDLGPAGGRSVGEHAGMEHSAAWARDERVGTRLVGEAVAEHAAQDGVVQRSGAVAGRAHAQ